MPITEPCTILAGTIKRIHVDQHAIRRNRVIQHETPGAALDPVVTVKTSKGNFKGTRVKILGPSEVVYSSDKPLSCGARVWIETHADVEIK